MLRNLVTYLLVLSLSLPVLKDWDHLLSGNHKEIHCDPDIPNHIHQAEFDCDFHKFHYSLALEAIFWNIESPVFHYYKTETPDLNEIISRTPQHVTALRGPPALLFL